MTGSQTRHLLRRNGMYYLRVRVPSDLKALVGLSEVRRTLNVHSLSEAKPLALKFASRVLEAFAMLQAKVFSKDDARRLVRQCYEDLAKELDHGLVPETDLPELEIAEQVEMWNEVNCNVRDQLESKAFAPPVTGIAKNLVNRNGYDWEALANGSRQDVMAGVSQALLEAHRLFLFRLENQLQPYQIADNLFEPAQIRTMSEIAAAPTTKTFPAIGPSVKAVVDHFIQSKRSNWTSKTFKSRETRLRYLVEFLGPERALSTVKTADLREFSECLLKLRNRNTCLIGKTFSEMQTDNAAHRISPYTANLKFITIKLFFAWATSTKGYIESDPAVNLNIDVPKKEKKALKARRPFSADELQKIFSAPLYTGCVSSHRRFDAGKHVYRDDKFWIPLVAYFTGMRLGEIVQLHVEDVVLGCDIPHIIVTDLNSGEIGSDAHKSIKSDAGVRKVPLHPGLLKLGFEEFIARRRKEKHAPSARIFWRTAYGQDGQASTVFSKWFGRFLAKLGLSDPALVFHSFRHNAEDALRETLKPQFVIDRIIGHSNSSTSAGYGEGPSLEIAYKVVTKMKLKFIPHHIGL